MFGAFLTRFHDHCAHALSIFGNGPVGSYCVSHAARLFRDISASVLPCLIWISACCEPDETVLSSDRLHDCKGDQRTIRVRDRLHGVVERLEDEIK
jgi:hypothetical protein